MEFYRDALRDGEIVLKPERFAQADPEKGWLPAYHFDICRLDGERVGRCDLRIGYNKNIYYGGNIGYTVFPPYRGNRYAEKACRLLFTLARRHGMKSLVITCAPDNVPSLKTCENLGGRLREIALLPEDSDMRRDGRTHTRVYFFEL